MKVTKTKATVLLLVGLVAILVLGLGIQKMSHEHRGPSSRDMGSARVNVADIRLTKENFATGEDISLLVYTVEASPFEVKEHDCCITVVASLLASDAGDDDPPTPIVGYLMQEAPGLYTTDSLPIGEYTPGGIYFIRGISVRGEAGNRIYLSAQEGQDFYRDGNGTVTNLPILKFTITDNDRADTIPPTIGSLNLVNEFLPGGEQRLTVVISAYDTGEGMPSGLKEGCCVSISAYHSSGEGAFDEINGQRHNLQVNLMGKGPSLYHTSYLYIGEEAPPGNYAIRRLGLRDKAGNRIYLSAQEGDTFYRNVENDAVTKLHVLGFSVNEQTRP